jgi:2,4-dienoyl-CoA reductase-like NADH-dependent reductase (Old Yellow Enzyme family)
MSITTHNAAGVLDTPLALPSGATIKNRLVKAAMSDSSPASPARLPKPLSGSTRAGPAAAPGC